ncbi:MAG: RpiB/LacA/LacB family sugar-phosphate isomerase [Candidatus Saccharimonadales bacterium]
MKIYIGADHNGYEYKTKLVNYLETLGNIVVDEGDSKLDSGDDFPIYAKAVAEDVLNNDSAVGILICASGQGMCIAANRYRGIRATLCWDEQSAHSARNDDDANILCLSAESQDWDRLKKIIDVWLNTKFANEDRFKRRINEMDRLG